MDSKFIRNQTIQTPIGPGIYQGEFELFPPGKQPETVHLVEIPVNDDTRPFLKRKNCMTRKAEDIAKFLFHEHDLA